MEQKGNKHENYEILNLLGYGLSKFDNSFIKEFGFTTKTNFFNYFVEIGIVETGSVVKNRMDLFDPFFPNNGRKGWWQKGDAYIHRKYLIDSLFGNENVKGYSDIVKLYLKENYKIKELFVEVKPIVKSRFKKLQETGLEAELYFMNNFNEISAFNNGILEDQDSIAEAIRATKKATDNGEGINSIINLLSLSSPASLKDVTENDSAKMLQIVMSEMNELRTDFRRTLRRIDEKEIHQNEMANRFEIEFEKTKMELRKMHEYVIGGAPTEMIKEMYDRIQNRLIRIIDRPLSMSRKEQAKDMLIEAEHILAMHASKKG